MYSFHLLVALKCKATFFFKVRANINRPLYNPDIVKKIYRFNFQCEKKQTLALSFKLKYVYEQIHIN